MPLNIGILAHIDAGKTSLTERLLYDTGAIARLGSVDGGDTQTDTGAIERQRGITVRSAVAAFTVGATHVNLIDTPGHPDFIAEVERALGVLDGVVLVLSAVEGVQAQTRVLMRTVREMRLPTLLFANKIDRRGARDDELLAEVRRTIAPNVVKMTRIAALGTRVASAVAEPLDRPEIAEVLAETDDRVLARVVEGPPPTAAEVADALAAGTAAGRVQPLFAGSALSGAGIPALLDGIVRLLPPAPVVAAAGPRGTVFAVEREPSGQKLAYVRLFAGEVRPRQRVVIRRRRQDGGCDELPAQVTSLRVVGRNGTERLVAGDIGRLGGLEPKVGDRLGGVAADEAGPRFARPTLRTTVRPRDPADAGRLHAALTSLADEDPLIHAHVVPGGATEVLLYGEVQKEVIAERLAIEHGVEAEFTPSRIVCVERPVGVGEAVEEFGRRGPALGRYWATVGLRVEPGPRDSGVTFRYETELGALPRAFHTAIEETVHLASRRGPQGWAVTDCRVTLVRSGFDAPTSVAADFRCLTALVLARALERAGTRVYEPYHAFELEIPADVLSEVVARITVLGARIAETAGDAARWRLAGTVPARRLDAVQRTLPGLTRGEAVWWTRPAADQPS
ncbi:TetM/TetW/TetO/TetS family tetracycline resistance ribosomal protection protein [Pseudonocardia sp. DSM 110487]|uniref:elongation factor G n=1 Tax=Pseudonocardia sp. DSM 110487 TaxID=2865833 RepID=UPI001C695B22|nr:TetM/TetW/TetO/TetS family tetracycline resistance ribosomal protection protein [Pseudonocardia sp. DSM 110487]QYN35766.1 TetM/TetW/TetO/TetS family tetracycline resistance ribosomal protection protein [Pseudonocardia sp. DSM 110487]